MTLGATIAVDPGRVEANKARQAVEAVVAAANDSGDYKIGDSDNIGDDDYNLGSSEQEEKDLIERVISCHSKEYRKILSVKETYSTLVEEKREILNTYRDLG